LQEEGRGKGGAGFGWKQRSIEAVVWLREKRGETGDGALAA
jgi:hypothetical protein